MILELSGLFPTSYVQIICILCSDSDPDFWTHIWKRRLYGFRLYHIDATRFSIMVSIWLLNSTDKHLPQTGRGDALCLFQARLNCTPRFPGIIFMFSLSNKLTYWFHQVFSKYHSTVHDLDPLATVMGVDHVQLPIHMPWPFVQRSFVIEPLDHRRRVPGSTETALLPQLHIDKEVQLPEVPQINQYFFGPEIFWIESYFLIKDGRQIFKWLGWD